MSTIIGLVSLISLTGCFDFDALRSRYVGDAGDAASWGVLVDASASLAPLSDLIFATGLPPDQTAVPDFSFPPARGDLLVPRADLAVSLPSDLIAPSAADLTAPPAADLAVAAPAPDLFRAPPDMTPPVPPDMTPPGPPDLMPPPLSGPGGSCSNDGDCVDGLSCCQGACYAACHSGESCSCSWQCARSSCLGSAGCCCDSAGGTSCDTRATCAARGGTCR